MLENRRFVVDERPHVVWGNDLLEVDRRFLAGLDAEYFSELALTYSGRFDESDGTARRMALALRTAYAQGSETLLAILFASLQAPDCVVGWLDRYQSRDLERLVSRVRAYEPILSKVPLPAPTWPRIADALLINLVLDDKEREQRIKRRFGEFWDRLAREFEKGDVRDEYNHVKHGLRVYPEPDPVSRTVRF